jgi:Fusaric acid resistance protein-like
MAPLLIVGEGPILSAVSRPNFGAGHSDLLFSMQFLDKHESTFIGLTRGIRAAIVLPFLFALSLVVIGQPVMAGFAVFGTFAHLVMVNYSPRKGTRHAQSGALTVFGMVLLTLGTVVSTSLWLTVASAGGAGALWHFAAERSAVARAKVSVLRSAMLMTFLLAVAVPTPVQELPFRLAGWLLAGLMAQGALWLLWLPVRPADRPASGNNRCPSRLAGAISGVSMGLAVLVARLFSLDHAFWVVLGVVPVLAVPQTSAAQTFGRQQTGTLLGVLCGILLVSAVGSHQLGYWIILPFTVLVATYLSSAVGFMAGQAAFTVFAVVLFCILAPLQRHVGIVRIEDIAIGGAISLIVGSCQPFAQSLRGYAISARTHLSRNEHHLGGSNGNLK